jgi:hypothetical protein
MGGWSFGFVIASAAGLGSVRLSDGFRFSSIRESNRPSRQLPRRPVYAGFCPGLIEMLASRGESRVDKVSSRSVPNRRRLLSQFLHFRFRRESIERYHSIVLPSPFYLPGCSHDTLYSPTVLTLGRIHWILLRASTLLEKRGYTFVETHPPFGTCEAAELGKEVGKDEINWWLTRKEQDIETLRVKTKRVRTAVQKIKKSCGGSQTPRPTRFV